MSKTTEVTQKQFEKALTVASFFFRNQAEVITNEGEIVQKDIGSFHAETFLSTMCWKLERMVADQEQRHDQLVKIALAHRRSYDGTEIAIEKVRRITLDLQNSQMQLETLKGAVLSAKGVYLEEVGRPYGERRNKPVPQTDELTALDALIGGKTTRRNGTDLAQTSVDQVEEGRGTPVFGNQGA